MQRDKVARFQHLVDGMRFLYLRRQAPGSIHGDLRIVAEYVHTQVDRRIGNQTADPAQADHPERVVRQFHAGKLLLAFFDALRQRLVPAVDRAHECQRRSKVARRDQHARQHQFLHRIGVGAGRIEHGHAALAHRLNRNVVGACSGAADGFHRGGNLHLVQIL